MELHTVDETGQVQETPLVDTLRVTKRGAAPTEGRTVRTGSSVVTSRGGRVTAAPNSPEAANAAASGELQGERVINVVNLETGEVREVREEERRQRRFVRKPESAGEGAPQRTFVRKEASAEGGTPQRNFVRKEASAGEGAPQRNFVRRSGGPPKTSGRGQEWPTRNRQKKDRPKRQPLPPPTYTVRF